MLALLAALVCSGPTHPAPPARVSFLEGPLVVQEATGARELTLNEPLSEGAVLETGTGAFLEVEIAGGTFVRVGGTATVRLDSLGLDATVTLVSGALAVDPGPRSRTSIRGALGERLLDGRGFVEQGARGRQDRFFAWSEQRSRDTLARDALSVGEWELAIHGDWLVVDGRGAWKPRVDPAWRPFRDGEWRDLAWGWTWIPDESWSYVTVHQGRWQRHPALGWIWFRGDAWSAACVAWETRGAEIGWAPCSPPHVVSGSAMWIHVGAASFGSCHACPGGVRPPVRAYRDGDRVPHGPGSGHSPGEHHTGGGDDDGRGEDDDAGDDRGNHDDGESDRGEDDGGTSDEDGGTDQDRGEDDGDDQDDGGSSDDDGEGRRGGDDEADGQDRDGSDDTGEHDDNGHGNDDDHDDDSNPGNGGGGHGADRNRDDRRASGRDVAPSRDGWTRVRGTMARRDAAPARPGWMPLGRTAAARSVGPAPAIATPLRGARALSTASPRPVASAVRPSPMAAPRSTSASIAGRPPNAARYPAVHGAPRHSATARSPASALRVAAPARSSAPGLQARGSSGGPPAPAKHAQRQTSRTSGGRRR